MEFDVERLVGHLVRDEPWQEVLDDFLGQAREDVEGCDVEDFRPTAAGVRLVRKWSVVVLTSSRE